jgi:hypothetical protein
MREDYPLHIGSSQKRLPACIIQSQGLGDSVITIEDRRYRPCLSGQLLPLNRRRRCTLRLAFGKAWIVSLKEGDQQSYPQGYEG